MSETAQPHAVRQDHELKQHGDELEGALKPTTETTQSGEKSSADNNGTESKE